MNILAYCLCEELNIGDISDNAGNRAPSAFFQVTRYLDFTIGGEMQLFINMY